MLTLVPTPIGNIADTTFRSLEAFSNADILLCEDTRITKKLFHILKERYHLEITKEQTFISLHSHNEDAFIKTLQPRFFDQNIVYVSDAGMPGISDPGQALVRYCIDHDIRYDILPGANAVLTAFVASGFIQTQMLFFGFLNHKGAQRASGLQEALHNGYTTVLYVSPHRLEKLLSELQTQAPQRQLFLAKELTKKYQTFYHGTAQQISKQLSRPIKGEWVMVIEAGEKHSHNLSEHDILSLDLPKKVASKLISKITGENPKQCYQRLIEN